MHRKSLLREIAKTASGAEFTCNSASMEPTIRVGEKVRVHAVDARSLCIGDVVVYEGAEDIYMLHRIVYLSPRRRWFLHIGDAPTLLPPRRALVDSIVGRTAHARKRPALRIYVRVLRRLVQRTRERF